MLAFHGYMQNFLERRPGIGILASLSGLTASVLSALQQLSIILGFAGALFGLAAGIYTFLIKRKEWRRLNDSEK